jgi:hypothetical protein
MGTALWSRGAQHRRRPTKAQMAVLQADVVPHLGWRPAAVDRYWDRRCGRQHVDQHDGRRCLDGRNRTSNGDGHDHRNRNRTGWCPGDGDSHRRAAGGCHVEGTNTCHVQSTCTCTCTCTRTRTRTGSGSGSGSGSWPNCRAKERSWICQGLPRLQLLLAVRAHRPVGVRGLLDRRRHLGC